MQGCEVAYGTDGIIRLSIAIGSSLKQFKVSGVIKLKLSHFELYQLLYLNKVYVSAFSSGRPPLKYLKAPLDPPLR